MSRYFLTKLSIEGFRGINNEDLPLELKFKSDSVNSIFAVNGSGKSSIFEALTYAIRGSVPKLDSLQTQDKAHTYINNKFHSKQTATINLSFQADTPGSKEVQVTVIRDENGLRKVSGSDGITDPEKFLRSFDRDFTLVDYQTFARFMDDSPLNRGRSFSSLVGLAKYSNLRQMLQTLSDTRAFNTEFGVKELTTELETTKKSVKEEFKSLTVPFSALVTNESTEDLELTKIAERVVAALGQVELLRPHVESKELFEIDFDQLKDVLVKAEGGKLRTELSELNRWISAVEEMGSRQPEEIAGELNRLQELVDERDALAESTLRALHRKLFSDAQELLGSAEWEHDQICPLCNSKLDFSLTSSVNNQIDQLKHVTSKDTEIKNYFEHSRASYWMQALESLNLNSGLPEHQLNSVVRSACDTGSLSSDLLEKVRQHLENLENKLAAILAEKTARRDEIQTTLPPSMVQLMAQVDRGRQIQKSIRTITSGNKRITLLQAKIGLYARWLEFLGEINRSFANCESEMAASTLKSIEAEHKRLFKEIMRAGNVVPKLTKDDSKPDLHLHLEDFHGLSDLSAQALLSESYSNALAISLFLAAASQDNSSARFVVLDDITSSFDSGHQWQLMEQIRSTLQYVGNQSGIQFIILSHDGLLEKYFDTLGNNSNWHHQKLHGRAPRGAVSPTSQSADRLRDNILSFLHNGQTDGVGPLIRQYLEFKLIRLITKLQIPVPIDFAIKDTQKMVSNALGAIQAAILLHQKAGSLVIPASKVDEFEKSRVPAIIGNFTSHYATGSISNFTSDLLLSVMSDIEALDECFKYDKVVNGQTQRVWYKSLTKQ